MATTGDSGNKNASLNSEETGGITKNATSKTNSNENKSKEGYIKALTSKGIAGVPRASLVVVAATCGMFKIPVEGIALILPIDHFCDMFRSATNVLGNALATSVVGKWEKEG